MPRASEEKYTLGYSTSSMDWMSSRTADGHGAFFLGFLKSHMNLLDCGCGPGTLTIGFAERLRDGNVIGIDRETNQTDPVRELALERGLDNLDFVEGDIYALPYPDKHFDAVFASAVLGSIGNADDAVAEMVRVLKPGGVLGLKEFDHGADIIWPLNPVLEHSIELYHRLRAVNGHEEMAGRKLRGYLSGHGLQVEHLAAYFDQQTATDTLIKYVERNNGLFHEVLGPQFIEQGWCTATEIDSQVEAWREFARDPGAIYMSAWVEAVGRKPA